MLNLSSQRHYEVEMLNTYKLNLILLISTKIKKKKTNVLASLHTKN